MKLGLGLLALYAIVICVEGLTGRFIHLTDTHLLRYYGAGTDPNKGCIEGKSNGTAGPYGDYDCDTNWAIQNFTVQAIKARPKPDFILYGGDHVAVKDPKYLSEGMSQAVWFINDISRVLLDIRNAFGYDVRVFPMLGNHDSYPPCQFAKEGPFYVYEAAAKAWKDFLQPSSLETVRRGGYYTELIEPGFRLVVLNTALYFELNIMFPEWLEDPGGQLAWFRSVLQKAKEDNEIVYVAAHVPPGASQCAFTFDMWLTLNDQFVRSFEGYNGNPIVASFYGHAHFATYKIISDANVTKPTANNSHVGFVSTSLTPWIGENPAFTEYSFMPKRPYSVTDRVYYYIDIDHANKVGSMSWNISSSYREIIGSKTLDVETMSDAVNRMHDDPELFQKFYQDVRTHGPKSGACTETKCRHFAVCTMNNMLVDEFNECYKKYDK